MNYRGSEGGGGGERFEEFVENLHCRKM